MTQHHLEPDVTAALQSIAGYRLREPLGWGSSAGVYRGVRVDESTFQVAVKLLRHGLGSDLDRRMQFEHEAALLARLAHPNIVRLLAHGTEGAQSYLVTELATGRSLAHIVAERGACGSAFVAEALRQVALALAHAHGQRILHRDIKPSNIVVDEGAGPSLVAKLLDFGFAHQQGSEATAPGATAIGTFLYMSPEQLGILALAPDERSDLYALGIVALELLAGRHPFAGMNLRELIHAHAAIVPALPPGVPPALAQIVTLLLRKDPADRYRTAEGLAADLARFLARHQAGDDTPFPLRTHDRHAELTAPRFFGRGNERALLADSYAAAARELQMVAVAGASGMGKTRLIGEAARGWTRSVVLWGRGRAFGQTAGYGLMAEALRALPGQPLTPAMQAAMRAAVGTMGGEVLALVPELRALLGDAAAIAPLEPEHQQQRLFTLFAGLVSALGTPEAPLVLVLDDLQWADDGSLQFVLHLARRIEPRSLLLILAWRADEVPAGGRVRQWLDQVRAAHEVPLIALEGLTLADVRTLVASMLSVEVPGVAEAVAAQAQGHPLHAIELTHALVEQGTLRPGPQGWTLDAAHAARLARDTDDLLHTIVRRLDRLAEGDREVLAIAAVAGRGFGAEAVRLGLQADTATAAEPAARRTVAALAAAEQAQLIVAGSAPGAYSFVHDKIRESLYDALPAERRARLHGLIGDVLAATDPDAGATVYLLAYHYGNADDARKAIDAAMRAGAQASQHYAHLEALDFYRRAAALAGLGPDANLVHPSPTGRPAPSDGRVLSNRLEPAEREALAPRLAEAVADSQVGSGQFDAALAAYEALLPLPRPVEAMAELRRKLAMLLFMRGEAGRAATLLEEALVALGAPAPATRPAMLWQFVREAVIQVSHTLFPPRGPANRDPRLAALGGIYFAIENVYCFSDFIRALSIHLRSMNLMERERAVDVLGQAYSMHGPACMVLGMTARSIRYMERSLALRQAQGDRWGCEQTRVMLVLTLLAATRWEGALSHARIAMAELEQHGDPYAHSLSVTFLGLGLAYVGQWDEAEQLGERGHRVASESRHWIARGYAFVPSAEIAARLDLPALLSTANDVIASRTDGAELGLCAVLRAKGRALMLLGRLDEAEAVLREGSRLIYERRFRLVTLLGMVLDHVEVLFMLAERCSVADRRAELLRRGRRGLFKARLFAAGILTLRPTALRLRARADWLRGRHAPAWKAWGQATILAGRLGLSYQHALCCADWGAALLGSDPQQGANLRATAAAAFAALGAKHEFARWQMPAPATRTAPEPVPPASSSTALAGTATAGSMAHPMLETERMRALLGIAQQLSATRTIDTLLQAIVDSAAQLLGAERGMLYLWNAERSGYACHTHFGEAEAMAAPVSSSVLDGVLRGGVGTVVADAQADPGLDTAPSVMTSGVRSILCAPLVHQGEVRGALYLDNRLMRGLFAAKDLELLQALASQAAIALDNAHLYQQLEDHRSDLEHTVRERTAEAVEARRIAEAATQAKGNFLANMSHEIRTPMNAILGMSHLALQSGLNARQHNYVSKVERSARSLLGLINDILDFSKIEAGKLTMEHTEFSLVEVMDDLADMLALKAGEKGLRLWCSVAPGLPTTLIGDPLRLRQVLLNLGNNAVKFTEQGEITVRVDEIDRGPDGDRPSVQLRFQVKDTGIGMSSTQREGLFQPFTQADSSITRRYGGTGLGLAISRQLVELMHGTIELESQAGRGSTFSFNARFEMPAPRVRRLGAVKHAPAGAIHPHWHGRRVLLVEDNLINQELAVELLSDAGLAVTVAADGRQAIDALAAQRFDAVLMDCQMPVMDGYEATRAIRRESRWHALPIIAMTADVMAGAREKSLAAGMNDYIAKPINVQTMFETIARWLK